MGYNIWIMRISKNRVEDSVFNLSDERTGKFTYEVILKDFATHGIKLVNKPKYLGLGVGAARTETEISRLLKCSKTTFVDKNDRSALLPKGIKSLVFMQEDMFTFLEKSNLDIYDVVALIGVEYLIYKSEDYREFLQLVSKVLKRNGFIYIYPTLFLSTDVNLDTYGLKNVSRFPTSYLILVKQ